MSKREKQREGWKGERDIEIEREGGEMEGGKGSERGREGGREDEIFKTSV